MTSLTEFFNKHEDDALKGITHKNSIIKRNIIAHKAVNGECTLSELTKELHISVPTITKLVQELVDENIVTDLGKVETPGGRRPNIFGLANSAIYFAGVNVGRDNMRFLITDLQNNIIKEENDFTFELLDRPQCIERICSGIENFIAACAKIDIQGSNVHPGYAKNKMVNALDVACELQGLLPAAERPQYTEGYEGFYHCVGLNGTVENASVSYIIRAHDAEKFEQKKVFMWAAVDLLKKKYGDQVVTLTLKDQYYNMRKMVEPHPQVIDKALKAMEMAGVKPLVRPIRGGTDGARLSFMGLPCPNLFTGGMNFHGKFEYCSLTTMRKAQQVILNLAVLWSE